MPARARFCPTCGASTEGAPLIESVRGPVTHDRVEPHWFGLPAGFVLLCLAFAALGAAIGLFATGNWAWGVVAVFAAVVFFAALAEMTRGNRWTERSSQLATNRRARAATTAEVWRTRVDTSVSRWRTRSELDRLENERRPALQALGAAVMAGDSAAEDEARARLSELERERARLEDDLATRLAGAEERIRQARLPVQDTMMVTPSSAGSAAGEADDAQLEDGAPEGPPGPNAPYPPPGEADPPQPAEVPEPYPPPDEGTPPTPAPDPGQED